MVNFSQRLRELRIRDNLTQSELAEKVGLSKSAIAMYEQGRRDPSFESQEDLADYFNVDLDYLIGRSDRTTLVMSSTDASPERRFLMDRIAKADGKKLNQYKRLMELVDEEETSNW